MLVNHGKSMFLTHPIISHYITIRLQFCVLFPGIHKWALSVSLSQIWILPERKNMLWYWIWMNYIHKRIAVTSYIFIYVHIIYGLNKRLCIITFQDVYCKHFDGSTTPDLWKSPPKNTITIPGAGVTQQGVKKVHFQDGLTNLEATWAATMAGQIRKS